MWFILPVIVFTLFILYIKWRQTYWQRRGVPTFNYDFFFGHFKSSIVDKKAAGDAFLEHYRKLTKISPLHGGVYNLWKPLYIPLDPQLIKIMLVKDFKYFMNRGKYHHPNDITSMHLFNIEGEVWRRLRQILTPTFTSGKMKMMFETVLEKTEALRKSVDRYAENCNPCDIKDMLARCTTDIIGSCAFGIECNSLEEPESLFRKYGQRSVEISPFGLPNVFPSYILGNLGFKKHGTEVEDFFVNLVKQTMKTREEKNIFRKDFMHLMIELTRKTEEGNLSNGKIESKLTINDIVAQCYVFFVAGFETSSTAMTFALFELAQNEQLQERARAEVNYVLEKHEGKFTYESIMDMQYVEQIINESLRKYPPLSELLRTCAQDYKVPGTEVIIEKGTKVTIPVWGIQKDPRYYPNPEVFDPDRFTPENIQKRPEFTFLPFGEGPRICIGLRFGMMQAKLGLATMLKNFKFKVNSKTPCPFQMSKSSIVLSVEGNVWLDIEKV